jgi:DNA (cytosine-5)-methyltransferase 1
VNYLSVCSGIEAATVAWHPLGWTPVGFGEIERFPCQVLAHHYPTVPNFGDMTKFKEWQIESDVNVLVGGTPCQSFLVAGLRKGLDDPRGNLMLTYLAIAAKHRPKWLVWENVPGVLSSNGGLDFASLLRGMGELGYGFAYRVLDAQYFGVAQRRRRVFVVGYLGNWQRAAAVLFERHSLCGYPAPSREKGQRIAPSVTTGAPFSRTGNDRVETETMIVADCGVELTGPLSARDYKDPGTDGMNKNSAKMVPVMHSELCPSLKARDAKGPSSDGDGDGAILVPMVQPIALAENTIGRQPHNGGNGDGFTDGGPMYTLNATGVHGVAQPIPINSMNAFRSADADPTTGCGIGEAGEAMFTITKGNSHAVAQPIASSRNDDGRDATTDLSPTMRVAGRAGGMLGVAQPINIYGGSKRSDRPEGGFYVRMDEETTKTLDAASGLNPTCAQGGTAVMQPYLVGSLCARTGQSISVQDADQGHLMAVAQPVTFSNTADCLTAAYGTKWNGNASATNGSLFAAHSMAVRRLTPVECERLQGFGDNYTDIKPNGKPTPDGPRYKALGNSMAVPVMAWIGQRIQQVENIK